MNIPTLRVAQRLRNRASLFKSKNRDYGEAYLKTGEILDRIFPNGLLIKGKQKFREIGLLVRMLDKILRGTNLRFNNSRQQVKDEKSQDTLDDLGVYSFIWAELIERGSKKPSKKLSRKRLKDLRSPFPLKSRRNAQASQKR